VDDVAFDFLFFSHRVRPGGLRNQRRGRIISLTPRASERRSGDAEFFAAFERPYVMPITSPDYKTSNCAPSESRSFYRRSTHTLRRE
jgi:hypothetical protein